MIVLGPFEYFPEIVSSFARLPWTPLRIPTIDSTGTSPYREMFEPKPRFLVCDFLEFPVMLWCKRLPKCEGGK